MLENKSLHEREAPPLALLVKNGPLRAKLKVRENTVSKNKKYKYKKYK